VIDGDIAIEEISNRTNTYLNSIGSAICEGHIRIEGFW
jgi:hypothetical protein